MQNGKHEPPPGFTAVRQPIDVAKLVAWCAQELGFDASADPARLVVFQANNGMSNPTYLFYNDSNPERKWIVRKKPPGHTLKGAHQVDREYRVMYALKDSKVPVPAVRGFCKDESVLGKEFYVMDYCPGVVLSDNRLPDFTPTARAALWEDMVRILAHLHKTRIGEGSGLERHGKRGNYALRQLKTWGRQFRLGVPSIKSNVGKHDKAQLVIDHSARMERLIAELEARSSSVSNPEETTLVHGDYRLGNLILQGDGDNVKVAAVLDWEISTLGHPMGDLVYLLSPFMTDFNEEHGGSGVPKGMMSEREYIDLYCSHRGIAPVSNEEWSYWKALNCFRTAAIAHGVFARGLAGNAGSTEATNFWFAFVLSTDAGLRLLGVEEGSGLAKL